MESEKIGSGPVPRGKPGPKPKVRLDAQEAEMLARKIRAEMTGPCGPVVVEPVFHVEHVLTGVEVEYVCRNNRAHRSKENSVSYDKERYCVYCHCLMAVRLPEEPPCTEAQ